MKSFLDPNNRFRWFIEHEQRDGHTAEPTGETVTSYFRYKADFERGLERYGSSLLTYGIYEE